MNIRTNQQRVLELGFNGSVTQIEVEKILPPAEEDPDDEKHVRTVRFTTDTGDVLEVYCTAYFREDLEFIEVDQLGPVKQSRARSQRNWLRPKRSKRKTG